MLAHFTFLEARVKEGSGREKGRGGQDSKRKKTRWRKGAHR